MGKRRFEEEGPLYKFCKEIKLENIKIISYLSDNNIPLFSGRPKREIIINNDDIINLIIELNINDSVDHFLKNI